MSTLNPRIYAACLLAYQKMDKIHGLWIDATQSVSVMEEKIREMLFRSSYPNEARLEDVLTASPSVYEDKWAIHCTQDFGKHIVRRNDDLKTIADKAVIIARYGQKAIDALDCTEGNVHFASILLGNG